MAEAYVARRLDDPTHRKMVLKRIRPDLAHEEEYLRRFVLEAQVASRLEHPNLVRFVEFGRVGECHYICMDFVRGRSLHRLLEPIFRAHKPPSLPAALHVGVGIFDGLAVMHSVRDDAGSPRPMLHRDVTPANVIIAEDGRPVIIDFGIAKDVFGPAITLPGRVIGTARYMAPEHRRAEFIDTRADVFSASAILFEVLTGHHPWPALESVRELLRTTFDPPELTPTLRSRIPDDIEPILLRGLACDPEDRFPDAAAMAHALRETDSFRSTAALGGRAVLHWLADQRLEPDESLDGPVVDADHLEGVTWTEDGVLSARPQWSGGAANSGSGSGSGARAGHGSGGEQGGVGVGVGVRVANGRGTTSDAVLSIPPLPPRRDAALGDSADDFAHASRVVPAWFPRVAAFLALLIFFVTAVLFLLLR